MKSQTPYTIIFIICFLVFGVFLFNMFDYNNNRSIHKVSFSGKIFKKIWDKYDHNQRKFVFLSSDKKTTTWQYLEVEELWDKAQIGDSIYKESNSYVYRLIKIQGNDTLIEEFEYKPR